MLETLKGLEGLAVFMDDILVYGATVGHWVIYSAILEPEKVKVIHQFLPHCNVQELKTFLGMVNYLGSYIPVLSTVGQPLYEMLMSKSIWTWGHPPQSASENIKIILTTAPVLTTLQSQN